MTNGGARVDQSAFILSWLALAGLAYLVFLIVHPFLTPLAWAAVIAIVFYPVHARFARRWGPSRAAALSTITVTVIVIIPVLLVTIAFVREAISAMGDLQRALAEGRFAAIERAWSAVLDRVPGDRKLDVAAIATEAARRSAIFVASRAGVLARNTAGFVFDLVLALFATFFLLRDSWRIVDLIRRVLPIEEAARERLIATTRELVSTTVSSSGVVAAVQGLLGGLVFAAVGIDAPVFWGVVMAFFCLLPLGAWVIWMPAAALLAASGAVGRAAIVAGLGVGIVSAVDNVLRPMLLSGHTAMNGLLIFVSLLGGIAAFGAIGLVLGPLVMATGLAILTTYADSRAPSRPRAE